MPSDRTHLLIPIHVDALVVGKDDKGSNTPVLKNGTVSAAPDYSSLEEEYLVGPELRQPREKVKPSSRERCTPSFPSPSSRGARRLKQDTCVSENTQPVVSAALLQKRNLPPDENLARLQRSGGRGR